MTAKQLVVRGPFFVWLLPSFVAATVVAAFVLASIVAISYPDLPWMLRDARGLASREPLVVACLVVFVWGGTFVLAREVLVGRAGRVTFSPQGVVFERRGLVRRVVHWSQLEAYGDGRVGWIDLVRKGERFARADLAIPTPDETLRVAVLRALDERGLVRAEAPGGPRRFFRAAAVGAVAVGVFLGCVYLGNSRLRAYRAFCACGSRSEVAAVLSRWVQVRHRVVQGAGDFYVQLDVDFEGIPAYFAAEELAMIVVGTRIEVDGHCVNRPKLEWYDCKYCLGGLSSWERRRHEQSYSWGVGKYDRFKLTPGRHDLRIVSSFMLESMNQPPSFAWGGAEWGDELPGVKETLATIDVEPPSEASRAIELVRGEEPTLSLFAQPNFGRWGLIARYSMARALAARVAVLENGKVIAHGTFAAPAREVGSQTIQDAGIMRLSSGRHVLKARFTPDADLAFERELRVTEMFGEPFEREVTIEVP